MLARLFAAFWLVAGGAASDPAPVLAVPNSAPVAAHDVGQSYVFLRVYEDSMLVRLEVTDADLERVLGFGWDPAQTLTIAQVEEHLDAIRAYVEARFSIATPAGLVTPRFRGYDLLTIPLGDYVQLDYAIDGLAAIPDAIDVFYSVIFEADSQHRNFLIVEHNWKTGTFNNEANISLIFTPSSPTQTLDLTASSVLTGFISLIKLGVWHIWIGYDHIMFLLALVLPSVLMRRDGGWQPVPEFRAAFWNIVTIVTFFTIAHSVTLSLAALDMVHLPSRLVESIIAGSIGFAAWANLVPRLNVREWAIAFGFGLFHGFGFASVLGDIGVGGEYLALSLFGFNLGVELGQIAIIALVFPLIFMMRKAAYYPRMMRLASYAFIAMAILWIAERGFGINVPMTELAVGVGTRLVGLFTGAP